MRLLPYGPDALLAELSEPNDVVALREAALALPGVLEAVAGAVTVLVEFDLQLTSLAAVRAGLESAPLEPSATAGTSDHVDVPVAYSGADLSDVAARTGLTEAEVVARHCAPVYTVRFCGFAPGFAYLDGLDPTLYVPRLETPRTEVPAGSVAIAGEFTAVYPRRSPGGWRLLGTTSLALWDTSVSPPALLSPGTTVRFVPE